MPVRTVDNDLLRFDSANINREREFALVVIENISTPLGLREYARRLREKSPQLSDLADECLQRAKRLG